MFDRLTHPFGRWLQRALGLVSAEQLQVAQAARDAALRAESAAQERLLECQQILAAALSGTGAGCIATGPDGCIVAIDPMAAQVTGWDAGQARGRRLEEVLVQQAPLADAGQAPAADSPGADSGDTVQHRRTTVIARDGRLVPVELSALPGVAGDGSLRGGVVVLRDVTHRLDAEARRRSAEARFALVVQSAPNGLLMADTQGCITLVNPQAAAMFGYSQDELLGQPIELLVPERARSAHRGQARGLFDAHATRAMGSGRDLVGQRKDGSVFPVEIGLSPLVAPEGRFMLASIIDITQRQQRDDELRRSNADLEQFAYVASHDLQEPLRMVASYTELLAQRYQGQLDERADKYIFYAVDGAKRMQRLVADLLAFARVGSQGKPAVPVEAGAVLASVLFMLNANIQSAGATVTAGPLPRVMADADQLHQLLQNLIGNAIKFRGEAAPVVHVAAVAERERWVFSVRDNGIGIEARYADRVFQMFQRLHERGRYEGSGIGLAIAKRILERHGGTIWLESTPGAGSTFFFSLPAAPAAETAR